MIVPTACRPSELLDAAASPGAQSRGDDGGSPTEVGFASAIPTSSGAGETLADVTNDMELSTERHVAESLAIPSSPARARSSS